MKPLLVVGLAILLPGCTAPEDTEASKDPNHGEEFSFQRYARDAESRAALEERLRRLQETWGTDSLSKLKQALEKQELPKESLEEAERLYSAMVDRLSAEYEDGLKKYPELRAQFDALRRFSENSEEYQAAKKVIGEKLPELVGPAWDREMQTLKRELGRLGLEIGDENAGN